MVLTFWIEQKLSATASAFQPYGFRVASINTAPIPGTAQHLNAIIAAATSPSKPTEIVRFGMFTTDTLTTRNIKVSSLKDLNISAMIHTSLDVSQLLTDSRNPTDKPTQQLLMKGHKQMGSRRMENDGHDNIYLRLAHIGDALAISKAISTDHKDLLVDFVSTETFAQVSLIYCIERITIGRLTYSSPALQSFQQDEVYCLRRSSHPAGSVPYELDRDQEGL
jgi:hypothetical protein